MNVKYIKKEITILSLEKYKIEYFEKLKYKISTTESSKM